ncbi:cadherin-like domain-containing protein [Planktothrix agardhii 1029]|uniref:Ig-like domain-containing protein n=1 Tax=Planktothrix agardhii TaxID=1160 RepID=UPI001F17E6B5|nr:Ig-like domain-containing protein [Planktothrix agardhii]MCF3566672.1 cadherin-like domain-containing protein [Planktothrix agardhii 1807]MCF3589853.1 cadherin-like domain-containing protein [Planktothrix agardhii 1029]MCF3598611.1 cadherin-like domain-containing protein [Planktothrix agardhii 1032]MCF3620682.1 cadherin-like domain-containing protein [Planktothrix agardhii 1030]
MPEQIIRANPSTVNASRNNPVSFDVTYNTANPSDPTLIGLGFRLHFNSQELAFTNLTNILPAPIPLGPQEQRETAQTDDGDPSTNSFVLYSWTDISSQWPGADKTYPVTLYTANFTALPAFDGTTINFTRSATASGYTFDAQPLQINLLTDTPPTISDITAQTTNEDIATAAIPFIIGDDLTPVADLQVTYTSSNLTLIPAANIALGGSGSARTLTVTPAANQAGSSDITVTVTDGTNQATSDTFTLTVNPVNDLPTITDITNQTTAQNTATAAIPFTIGDVETPVADLQVAVTSDNPTLVPNNNIVLGGAGSDRTLTVTPAASQNGTANITVTVTDADGGISSDAFALNVAPPAGITVAPTTGLTTDEAGKTATFTVKLDAQPTADVTIPVLSSNTLEGTAAPASLVFNAANWNIAQTVTVTIQFNCNLLLVPILTIRA